MGAKLLLADDSVTVQRVIELTFADEDIEVVAVGDGQRAIAQLETERPDIVLADADMPHLTGYDVAAHIRRSPHLRHVPVLLLTGAFDPVDEARLRAAGCDGVLVKPFEPQTVVARVRELLARRPAAGTEAGESPGDLAAGGPAADLPAGGPLAADAPDAEADSLALDEYFSQLDAALADLTSAPAPGGAAPIPPVSTVGESGPREPSISEPPAAGGAPPPLVETFSALLDAEARGAAPPPVPLRSGPPDEALIEAVAQRVIERLTDRVVREVVADVTLETAERLVREEIERIKRGAG